MHHLKKNIREPKPEPGGSPASIGVAAMGWAGEVSMPKGRRVTGGRVGSVAVEWLETLAPRTVVGRPWAVTGVGGNC